MKESISIAVDAVQKKRLIEEAHKRNLSLKEYLRLLCLIRKLPYINDYEKNTRFITLCFIYLSPNPII